MMALLNIYTGELATGWAFCGWVGLGGLFVNQLYTMYCVRLARLEGKVHSQKRSQRS